MGRIKHICETCEKWDREHMHQTGDGKHFYAQCLARIYSRLSYDKCSLWEKRKKNDQKPI